MLRHNVCRCAGFGTYSRLHHLDLNSTTMYVDILATNEEQLNL